MEPGKTNPTNAGGKKPQAKDLKANQGKEDEVKDMGENGDQMQEDVNTNEMGLLDDFISSMKELGYGK